MNRKGSLLLEKYLKGIGIDTRQKVRIKEIYGAGECEGVELESGERLASKLVIVTAGVKPDTALAGRAGLAVGRGIIVNDYMQTSDPDILAAGDAVEHKGITYGLWNAAQQQGKVAALNALGIPARFEGMPNSTILKVLGLDIFSTGDHSPSDPGFLIFEREDGGSYCFFAVKDRKITAGIVIGDRKLSLKVKRAVEKETELPADACSSTEGIIAKLMES